MPDGPEQMRKIKKIRNVKKKKKKESRIESKLAEESLSIRLYGQFL